MHHVAIMQPHWKLIPEIIAGRKTIETRWYKTRRAPWDQIHADDIVYFKDSGQPVTAQAEVARVEQYENLTEELRQQILAKHLAADVGDAPVDPDLEAYTQHKRYCIIIHLCNPQPVEPFMINKKGFGAPAAWLVVNDVSLIQ